MERTSLISTKLNAEVTLFFNCDFLISEEDARDKKKRFCVLHVLIRARNRRCNISHTTSKIRKVLHDTISCAQLSRTAQWVTLFSVILLTLTTTQA